MLTGQGVSICFGRFSNAIQLLETFTSLKHKAFMKRRLSPFGQSNGSYNGGNFSGSQLPYNWELLLTGFQLEMCLSPQVTWKCYKRHKFGSLRGKGSRLSRHFFLSNCHKMPRNFVIMCYVVYSSKVSLLQRTFV